MCSSTNPQLGGTEEAGGQGEAGADSGRDGEGPSRVTLSKAGAETGAAAEAEAEAERLSGSPESAGGKSDSVGLLPPEDFRNQRCGS